MDKRVATIKNGKIVYGEEADMIRPTETEARASRNAMKTKYRKDMLQPNQVDYYKVHKDQADNLSPELRRLLS